MAATGRRPISIADARIWQITALSSLLVFGVGYLGFDQPVAGIGLILAAAMATEWVGRRYVDGTSFDPLSPMVTALSLSILLRAVSPGWLMLAAVLAIGSKFVVRVDGKHVFNPANLGIVLPILLTDSAWVSPAQWGSATWTVFLFVCLAVLVLSRARRTDIALAFLVSYGGLLVARALYLGDPMAIPLKQLQSGGVLLFAFFMITDPKTTPDRQSARLLYAGLVAATALWLQFGLYLSYGLLLSLFLASPLVPVLDRLLPRAAGRPRFHWHRPLVN